MQLNHSVDFNQYEQKLSQLSSQILTDKSTPQSIEIPLDEIADGTLNITNNCHMTNTNSSDISSDPQSIVTDKSIPPTVSDITKLSCFLPSTTNETLNPFDSRSIPSYKHSSTPTHLISQILTPDNNVFTPPHQHFPYPLFTSSPDSPPLSTSSCNSMIGNSFYNTFMSGHQHSHEKESRRDSITKFSIISSPNYSPQYLGSDNIASSEFYDYTTAAQQILNSFATEFYRINDFQTYDPYNIQWAGHIILKNDQAYIKTQLIAGNPQIARISIDYWNSNLNHNLHISQRMRLEEIQLNGVKKRMEIDNDHCILIAEPNGLTPNEIDLEKTNLKNGLIQYLNEKQAAGIINILLPGVLQPVYIVHIFPPCQFASEILQKRAPDAYRCVVQNKLEQIYLLFIITSTIQ